METKRCYAVDCLHDFWLTVQARFPHIKTVLLNQDNGSLLDSVETVLKLAQTMTWNGQHPTD
jgi:hypothetical protein